ncbi:YiiX/YebB-like N1pC/P60 family cysteine hydrolase [Salinisphaera sp. SPP-AMP-43]|uniref:YiiX/YebB-like N1pC/P60 family cysteine hydrolase n=1 Tax=Salinisphaera sp. SPP-AMP-43 TaxID=3121288 RepID=UPI003C6E3AF7
MSAVDQDGFSSWRYRLVRRFGDWLATDVQPRGAPRTDFERLCEHLRPGDVVLVEGRTRASGVIQSVTLSSWSHAALYIGRISELEHEGARQRSELGGWPRETPMLVEAEMGRGVCLSTLARYRGEHLRICRPRDLAETDRAAVIAYACERLGTPYDMRQIADLLRFFLPYGILPRRWRSTLFEAGHGDNIRAICSTLLANAFASVRYPILPTIHRGGNGEMVFHRRNGRLITPRDFDHSPYFDIIKFPFFGDDVARYHELDWDEDAPRASRPAAHRAGRARGAS